jgi:DNA-binding HxlR family transcriptional regulator
MAVHSVNKEARSGCPINLSLEVFGDRWSLLILRDIIFGGKRHFRELQRSDEEIASNILADRLKKLVESGLLTKRDDPAHKQKGIYSLTEMSIALVPVLAHLGAWGRRWLPVSEDMAIRAQLLEEGGPRMWGQFMDELRQEHLALRTQNPKPRAKRTLVREHLESGYQALIAKL